MIVKSCRINYLWRCVKGIISGLLIYVVFTNGACADYTEELGEGYYYYAEGAGARIIAQRNNKKLDNGTTIYPTVLIYDYDKTFIIAKQSPSKDKYAILWAIDVKTERNLISNSNYLRTIIAKDSIILDSLIDTMRFVDSIIRNDSMFFDSVVLEDSYFKKMFSNDTNYWIIYKPEHQVLGPYTYKEFVIKRKELKVPDDLDISSNY
ncbi:MAG: hypothetical protein LBL74_00910 [Bacteroidales bacterium]|jgi:hypothetical protein|nr:hypothetical protein [Bacteroidales bacterium]